MTFEDAPSYRHGPVLERESRFYFNFLYFVTNIVQYQCSDEAVVTEKLINQ